MAGEERQDAGTFAYTLVEHIADVEGDENAQAYLVEMVEEIMLLDPGVREHLSDLLLTELKEEIARCEDSRHSRAVVGLIEQIENDWRNQQ